ncbi:hypothetical protein RN001_000077 [Aquatica leii]|uniref:Uncharacterized protein n=1 Tax=Aquatica leii TaxID=1421715 RepID=A0AAN7PLT7_9COLE|nr:hypothetical protein RN001_000077 [Aquatica leii]
MYFFSHVGFRQNALEYLDSLPNDEENSDEEPDDDANEEMDILESIDSSTSNTPSTSGRNKPVFKLAISRTNSNLNESQEFLATESQATLLDLPDVEDNSLQSEQGDTTCQLQQQVDVDESAQQAIEVDSASNIAGRKEDGYQAMKSDTQAKRKETLNTPAHQMVQILKESSALRKKKYENQTTAIGFA